MTALITGGAGYLGRHVALALARSGQRVTVLDDLSCANSSFGVPELSHPGICCVRGSTNGADWPSLLADHRIVVHFASVVGVEETIGNPMGTIRNLEGTTALAAALTADHIAVFGSSADVYGLHSHVHDRPMHEDDLQVYEHAGVPRWVYSRVKGLEEILLSDSAARTMCLRFFNCFGPNMDFPNPKRVVPQFVGQVLAGKPLQVSGDGRQTRTLCYFQDLVDGIVGAVRFLEGREAGYSATVNLGGKETMSVLEIARRVIDAALDVGLIDAPLPIETHAALYSRGFDDTWNRVPDLTRARELFGYEPKVPVHDGLRRTLAYHMSEVLQG